MCEDFETNGAFTVSGHGKWYAEDCDTANRSGGIGSQTKGWCGTIYANPITPAGAELCGAGITPFGNCVGDGGTHNGTGGVNMAMHNFKTPTCGSTAAETCGVSALYVRWYAYWATGYLWGAEKHMNPTQSQGDIAFAEVQLNCGTGGSGPNATPYIQIDYNGGGGICQSPNVSNISLSSGHWYFFELYQQVNAATGTTNQGIVKLWVNDCGATGTSCGASPILRTQMTGLNMPGDAAANQVQALWLENWANPPSSGTGPYWDQIKVATVGPIGFAGGSSGGDTTPPPAPSNLHIQ
jgi:hypothetical protein